MNLNNEFPTQGLLQKQTTSIANLIPSKVKNKIKLSSQVKWAFIVMSTTSR